LLLIKNITDMKGYVGAIVIVIRKITYMRVVVATVTRKITDMRVRLLQL
jgi:hypothetical protein